MRRPCSMKSLPETIIEHSILLPEEGVLAPKEFLHLASRAAVDQAFSRLTKVGRLMLVSRGLYVAPIIGRFGKRSPATAKVISAPFLKEKPLQNRSLQHK
ncbi:hypothetical protein FHJ31_17800 [Pseudomonas sp. Fig-3]|uniref:hypothetical protein n=1 Tax=unclassified Pseudomonas TaxID=196821 RepID=UPI00111256B6|nr:MULTISPECIES: hypothetical protein [unclassified Pseudomonas]TNB81400.1 hypothetical protein FHJ31_17800 [Pseudomonas sp. Fig-3]